MNVTTKRVNLVKVGCVATGPSLIEQAGNLSERAFVLARELDAVKAELADLEDVEIGWIGIVLDLMVDRDAWMATAYDLARRLDEGASA